MTPDATGTPLVWHEAVIERIVRRTARVVSVFTRSTLARHFAGQHVDVRLTADDGYQAQRSYSIASAPGSPNLELAIERLDDGEVSPYFHEVAQPGDRFEIRGPIGGHFVWRRDDGGPLLLVGGGSGIVPLVAMIRHRAQVGRNIPALLIDSARTWDDVIFRDELFAMQAHDANLSLVLTTTRDRRRREQDHERRLDRPLLREILDRWMHAPRHIYVCGSNAFVESVSGDLVREGVPATRIRTERYGGDS